MALNFMTDKQAEVFSRMGRDYSAGRLTNQPSPEVEADRQTASIAFRLSSELAATMRHDAMRRRVIRCFAPSGEKLRFSNNGQIAEVEANADLEKVLKSKKVLSEGSAVHAGRFIHNGTEINSRYLWIALDAADEAIKVERLSAESSLPELLSVINNRNSLWPTDLVLKVKTFGQFLTHAFSGSCGVVSTDHAAINVPDVVLLPIDGYGVVMIPQQGSGDGCGCGGDAAEVLNTGNKFAYLSTDRQAATVTDSDKYVLGKFQIQVTQSLLGYTHSQEFSVLSDGEYSSLDIRDAAFVDPFWSTLANRYILRTTGREVSGKLSVLIVVGNRTRRIGSVDLNASDEAILSALNAIGSDYELSFSAIRNGSDIVYQINKDPRFGALLSLSAAENCELISQAISISGTASMSSSGGQTRLELSPLDPTYFGDSPGFTVEKYFGGGKTRSARISIYQLGALCSDMRYGKLEGNINTLIAVSPPPDGSEKEYAITPSQ